MAGDTLTTVQAFFKPVGTVFSCIISNPFTKLATIVSRSNKIATTFVVRSAVQPSSSRSIKIQASTVLAQHVETGDFNQVAKKRRRSKESKRSWKTAAPTCKHQEAELLAQVGTNQLEPGNEY
jgi:hypothetical protein